MTGGWAQSAGGSGTAVLVAAVAVVVIAAVRGLWSPCGLSMISAINPMAERARGHSYPLTVVWYLSGALLGGAVLGGAAAVGSWLLAVLGPPTVVVLTVVAVAAAVTAAADVPALGVRLPVHPRQVNERWLGRYRRWVYAAGFGVQIGTGFATYIMSGAVYLTALLAVTAGSPAIALLVGLGFGLIRGLGVLATARVRDTAQLMALHRWLADRDALSLRLAAATQALAATVFAAVAFGWPGALAVAAAGTAAAALARARSVRGAPGSGCEIAAAR